MFPIGEEQPLRRPEFFCPEPEIPCVENLDVYQTRETYKLVKSVVDRAKELVEFVDSNRAEAKQAGIESIAIELSGMLEGGRLGQVLDALQLAAARNRGECITEEGLARLRRAEKLLAEANSNIVEFAGIRPEKTAQAQQPQQQNQPFIGQQSPPVSTVVNNNAGGNPSGGENAIIVPMVIIGVVGLAAIIAVIAFTSSRGER